LEKARERGNFARRSWRRANSNNSCPPCEPPSQRPREPPRTLIRLPPEKRTNRMNASWKLGPQRVTGRRRTDWTRDGLRRRLEIPIPSCLGVTSDDGCPIFWALGASHFTLPDAHLALFVARPAEPKPLEICRRGVGPDLSGSRSPVFILTGQNPSIFGCVPDHCAGFNQVLLQAAEPMSLE
jgi:hypothetical protein